MALLLSDPSRCAVWERLLAAKLRILSGSIPGGISVSGLAGDGSVCTCDQSPRSTVLGILAVWMECGGLPSNLQRRLRRHAGCLTTRWCRRFYRVFIRSLVLGLVCPSVSNDASPWRESINSMLMVPMKRANIAQTSHCGVISWVFVRGLGLSCSCEVSCSSPGRCRCICSIP